MSFAALSTVIAVFENLISFSMDKWGISRKARRRLNGCARARAVASVRARLQRLVRRRDPSGSATSKSIEDFIVSNNMLPLGSLIFLLFCVTKRGWGWENFLAEADAGQGVRFPAWSKPWLKYGVPIADHRHLSPS